MKTRSNEAREHIELERIKTLSPEFFSKFGLEEGQWSEFGDVYFYIYKFVTRNKHATCAVRMCFITDPIIQTYDEKRIFIYRDINCSK